MRLLRYLLPLLAVITSALITSPPSYAQDDPFTKQPLPSLTGRWDLTVQGPDGTYPSWLEVRQSGYRTLVGSYVGQFGSARPIAEVRLDGNEFRFAVPPQWEHRTEPVVVEGRIDGNQLSGVVTDDSGHPLPWTGHRAADLKRQEPLSWGEPIALFNGQDLSGWKARDPQRPHGWVVRDGVLVNADPGNDLVSEREFEDFRLHAEFRYPPGSNSGIYLRGRYEVQIEDNYGEEPESHKIGGVYGFLTPSDNAAKPAGEWQTLDLTLVGRELSVEFNGQRIIDRQTIPGITGGALDSDEAAPGPILLQGDHGQVEFRKLVVVPGMSGR